ncbi:MAG: hypothetical protein OEU26_36755, partial [Candidatus Tectomicrobia bacterium]|nr:hypothetical protein [Candidatus Tectomicrobia bacterium]
ADFVAVVEVEVSAKRLDLEVAVTTKQDVARGYENVAVADSDAAHPSITAAALEVNLTRIPVIQLLNFLSPKINRIYAAFAAVSLVPTNDGGCDYFG